ncbi:uridine kinase [Prauserella oleivorans]|uniref:uridine kinase n=1 Tax=Prauserella oleivorans TaxID=1478153 RepID=UPI003625B79F
MISTVARLVSTRSTGRLAVVIDGRTGAGKTLFGHELGLALERLGRPAYRGSLDDFKRPWSERDRYDRLTGEGYYRNAYDLDRIRLRLIGPVHTDGRVTLCGIDPLTQIDHGEEITILEPDAVLVVDGVFAHRRELAHLWDVGIWLAVDPDVAFERGVARDAGHRRAHAFSEAPDVASLHRSRYAAADDIYLRETAVETIADIIVENTDLDAPVVHSRETGCCHIPGVSAVEPP